MRLSFSDRVRFWKKVQKYQSDECWIWQGSKTSAGYGQLWVDCKQVYAHRVSWEIHYEAIPDGMFVCHTCDNPTCVSPAHLFVGTSSDNVQDMLKKGHHSSQICPEKQARGISHGSVTHPECLPRGDDHYSRKSPELILRGEARSAAKLTEESVRAVRRLVKDGCSQRKIAWMLGVSQSAICHVVSGRSWSHVHEHTPNGNR